MDEARAQQIKTLLENATYGLEALKDIMNDDILTAKLDSAVFGLSALENAIHGDDRTYVYLDQQGIVPGGTHTFAQDIYLINLFWQIDAGETTADVDYIGLEIQDNGASAILKYAYPELGLLDSAAATTYFLPNSDNICYGSIGLPNVRKIKSQAGTTSDIYITAFGYYFA